MGLVEYTKNVNFTGFTLVIPSVSVGNVPQFTVDLLISNYNFERVGLIWHPAIVPLIGADPYNEKSEEISTACELFVNEDLKIATLQNRSSFEYKMLSVFLEDLKSELVKHKFDKVVILASGFDHELHKIDKGKLFYVDNRGSDSILEEIGAKLQCPVNDKFIVEGGGYSIPTYEALQDIAHCIVIIKYVSEGNNTNDSLSMIDILAKYIPSLKEFSLKSFKIPPSWGNVFGPPPPIGMF